MPRKRPLEDRLQEIEDKRDRLILEKQIAELRRKVKRRRR